MNTPHSSDIECTGIDRTGRFPFSTGDRAPALLPGRPTPGSRTVMTHHLANRTALDDQRQVTVATASETNRLTP